MVELTQAVLKAVFAPPLVPVSRPIDAEHLSRMTMGDRELEREVLGLFLRQIEFLRPRIGSADLDIAGAAAHTLKGSATGIGTWGVARAASKVEAYSESGDERFSEAIQDLDIAISEAAQEISETLCAAAC